MASIDPSPRNNMEDITDQILRQLQPLPVNKTTDYKTLEAATPSFRMANIEAMQRVNDACRALVQGKAETTPLRTILSLVMDDRSRWYFQPDLVRDRNTLGDPIPSGPPRRIDRRALGISMYRAPPAYVTAVYKLIDEIVGRKGMMCEIIYEKLRFIPPPRYIADTVTDKIMGELEFQVDHYAIVINLAEMQRRQGFLGLPSILANLQNAGDSTGRDSTNRETERSDGVTYRTDEEGEEDDEESNESTIDTPGRADHFLLIPPELGPRSVSRPLPPIDRNRSSPRRSRTPLDGRPTA
jgi:hypothetical protein